MKSKFNKYLLSFSLLLICATMFAQEGDVPIPGTNNGGTPPPPGLPIDMGLTYLLVTGIAYGVYELKRKK